MLVLEYVAISWLFSREHNRVVWSSYVYSDSSRTMQMR
jgi:hypothetical protein